MNNLKKRTLSGIIFIALITGSLLAGSWYFGILFLVAAAACQIEFYRMVKHANVYPSKIAGITTGVILFGVSFAIASGKIDSNAIFILLPLAIFLFIIELYRKKDKGTENIATGVLGIIYIALPFSLINFIVFDSAGEYSPELMIALLLLIWTYDTCAYLFGVTLGKHRLFERISPKKSWEGAIGGALATIISSLLYTKFIPDISHIHWVILATLIVVVSTYGDLSESLIKRQFAVKDSGNLMPGHGGLLDRFDSLLFAVPVFICYIKMFLLP